MAAGPWRRDLRHAFDERRGIARAPPSQGDFNRALKEAEYTISMSPYDAAVVGDLSQVAIMSGRPDKGLQWINLALPLDPNSSKDLKFTTAWALRLLGKNDDAIAALKQSFYPDGASPLELAINLVRLGRMEEAKAEVKLMLEKNDPTFTQSKWRQASFYSDPSIINGEVADLGKAGLPEK
jgi:adenylate cyclase